MPAGAVSPKVSAMKEWTRGDPAKGPTQAPLARGGKLDADTLIGAYRAGIFPWYSADEPALPRAVASACTTASRPRFPA